MQGILFYIFFFQLWAVKEQTLKKEEEEEEEEDWACKLWEKEDNWVTRLNFSLITDLTSW